jgi:hypothetical protein
MEPVDRRDFIKTVLVAAGTNLSFYDGFTFGGSAALPTTSKGLSKVTISQTDRCFTTKDGHPFVPFGLTYYRPNTGWAPQLWKQFDAQVTRKDFGRMKALGVNCVRVFLSYGSFYMDPGQLSTAGLAKFDQFLGMADEAGIYVHVTGLSEWEGPPNWSPVAIEDERTLQALESFWKLFAARYRSRNVILAYDLANEPSVGWNEAMKPAWNTWLQKRYKTPQELVTAWGSTKQAELGNVPVPLSANAPGNQEILDFQKFREELADDWTRRQAVAIKSVDPHALVTVGVIQWSVPSLLPTGPQDYSGFRPDRQAQYLDFLEMHFYPLANGLYEYRNREEEAANLAYLQGIVREAARPGKPVILAEFGWAGGGKLDYDKRLHPFATEDQQAQYCRKAVETSKGFVCGWLNWGFYDDPVARDVSELTGLLTSDGKTKAWGKVFQELAGKLDQLDLRAPRIGPRPSLDWDACVTSAQARKEFREAYLRAFLAEEGLNSKGSRN